jgi:hypothetical protein
MPCIQTPIPPKKKKKEKEKGNVAHVKNAPCYLSRPCQSNLSITLDPPTKTAQIFPPLFALTTYKLSLEQRLGLLCHLLILLQCQFFPFSCNKTLLLLCNLYLSSTLRDTEPEIFLTSLLRPPFHNTRTCDFFMETGKLWEPPYPSSNNNLSFPKYVFSHEVEQGDIPPSCFSFHTVIQWPFLRSTLCPCFYIFVLVIGDLIIYNGPQGYC